MDDNLYQWLKKESKKRGTSMAAIVREALEHYLRRTENP
jgi:predicted DNA-binding protein